MGHLDTIQCLKNKLQVLDRILAKTETLCRFIKQRKMKGLKRVLGERDELIVQLEAIQKELIHDQSFKSEAGLTKLIQEVDGLQQEIVQRSRQAINDAAAERMCIAAELRNSKTRRQVQTQYLNPWASIVVRGRRINEKG